jgi:hypothetical protein
MPEGVSVKSPDGRLADNLDVRKSVLSGRAWAEFCDSLKAAGEIILRAETPATEIDRAEGWRYLSRLTRLALESKLEFTDPDFPEFYSLCHKTGKIGADNPDNIYLNATLDGSREYRIRGTLGTVPYISWGTKANRYATDGSMVSTGEIDLRALERERDGTFEIILSQRRQGRNWLPMAADTTFINVRQTFLDRSKEIPAEMTIACIGGAARPRPLTAAQLDSGLKDAAAFVHGTAKLFADLSQDFQRKPNAWIDTEQAYWQFIGGDPNIHYLHAYWELGPDEALILEGPVPDCEFWNFQLDNYWWESLDYRYLPVWVNKHSAKYNADGSVTIAIAARYPGMGNFVDTAGHGNGTMLLRWVSAKTHPVPSLRVVKL